MNDLIFEITKKTEKGNYFEFVISPLEQGYGHTLGNSLRRVLLSSLKGCAITSVKIDGVKHQFSSLLGMKEDMIEFVLNLKKVRFIAGGNFDKPVKATITVKSEGEVHASDIKISGGVSVANPELVIATLSKGAKLEAELEISSGVGYSSFEERQTNEIGVIPVDAIFSPVINVNYTVEETRVGRLTNYDKLILEITTDGTIKGEDAITEAGKILRDLFELIVNPKKITKVEVKQVDSLGAVGKLSVEEIGLPTRVANALSKAGYETVEDLVNAKKEDLVNVRNLGEKSLKIIAVALSEKNVAFPAGM